MIHQSPESDSHSSEFHDELHEDWCAYFEMRKAGLSDQYRGKFVVILKGEIIASSEDADGKLRANIATERSVDPERLVIAYIDTGTELHAA